MLRIYFILILISTFLFTAPLKIASSPKDTSYYNLAQSIKYIYLNNNFNKIIPLATHGSVENIQKLLSKKVALAIVQNDIAFFASSAHAPFIKSNENLRLVLPLFKEPIFILTNIKGINSIFQLINKKVVIGDIQSGLSESAKVILNSVNILSKVQTYQLSQPNALKKLHQHRVDAVFINNLTEEIKKKINNQKLFIIPISKNLVHKLQNTFPYFETHKFTLINKETISTIAIRSLLITRNDVDKKQVHKLIQLLTKHYSNLVFPDTYRTPLNELFKLETQLEWHSGVKAYFIEHKIITSADQIFNKYFWYIFLSICFGVFIILVTFLLAIYKFGWLHKFYKNHKFNYFLQKLYFYTLKYKYMLLLAFMILSYFFTVLSIKYFEHLWAIEHNIVSTFDENPFIESSLWLFIFGTTGYNGNFFPNSSEGKLLVSLIPMFGFGGFITLLGFITSDQIKKYILEAKGMAKINFTNHIIICGWNENTKLLIENLTHKNLSTKQEVVLLNDNLDYNPVEKFNFDTQFVKYVSGTPTNRKFLDKANIQEASIAIIVADALSSDPDARTILNVLAIERYCDDLAAAGIRKKDNDIYTIAEIIDSNNIQTANDAQVDQVVSLGGIESKIFTQSVQNPGVVKFINEIFTYDEYNDIYSFIIKADCKLIDKTYDEILIILRTYKILLLSINIETNRTQKEIQKIKQQYKLKREVITNPIDDIEKSYCVQEGDLLIVLAKYEEIVHNALKNINKELL